MKNKFIKKSLIIFQLVILFVSAIFFQIAAQENASGNSAEKIEIFEQVWSLINEKYYDADFNGVDWKTVGDRYRPLIEKSESDEEFYALLDKMAGELRDSHTRVFSPKRREDRKNRKSAGIGISLGNIENEFVVTEIVSGSEAAQSGVKTGMIVKVIDGQPAAEAFEKALAEIGASSSERALQLRALSKLLAGKSGTSLKLGLVDFDGKEFEIELMRREYSNAPQFVEKLLPSGLIYAKFGSFNENAAKQLEKSLRKNKNANGLILDLRGNGGGDGDAGLRVAGYFLNEQLPVARIVTRDGKPPLPQIPMQLEAGRKGKQIYSKPLIILIDEKTASVSELITDALQSYYRAYVIGTQTCGCVLAFLDYKEIKGGGDLSLSEFGFVTAKGQTLEGRGVTPDRTISPRLEDLRNGRDAALEEAEKFLTKLAKK
jgi:carboxyl-terminal processing protease